MSDTIIAALVTGGFAAMVSLVSVILSSRLTLYRIGQLERKVEKHNNLVERMAVCEQSIKSAHRRMDEGRP